MKTIVKLFLVSALIMSCDLINSNSINGSGTVMTIDSDLSDFSKLEISDAFNVSIHYGIYYNITLTIDDNLEKYIDLTKQGNVIRLFLEDGYSYENVTLEADIYLPILESISLSGACVANLSGFNFTNDLSIEISGASKLNGYLFSGNIYATVTDASELSFEGQGQDTNLSISGASEVDFKNFETDITTISITGASKAIVKTSGTLNVAISDASSVYYLGNPTIGDVSVSGASIFKPY